MRAARARAWVLAAALIAAGRGAAQEPGFRAVSVKASAGAGGAILEPRANGRFVASSTPLRDVILRADGVHESQLIGAPAWLVEKLGFDRFETDVGDVRL
jgi:hypothetical protein